ncbi:phage tail sheath subtilisin-like domain-containing protein [Streptomyces sp. NBC_01278]|uniref:phage tail sheath family protein n=1 Tax=Streptomyces sp. NBC_01278 TaxID=2903809 RepID=UPI002E37FB16|nr:phage tail sheath subtilisin-like domain-containing protein [Streptomyces sp. NBC_01278]
MNDRAPGVSSNDLSSSGVRPPSGSSTSIAALVGHLQAGEPRRITTWKEFDKDTPMADEEKRAAESGGARSPYLADAVSGWFANGGGTCWIVGAGQDGSIAGYEAALASLDPEVNIVITPDLWEGGDDGAMIARVIARHCAAAPNRMALLHTAKDADAAALPKRLGLNEEEAQYTTVYHPWLSVSGTSRGETRLIPPTGHVAGTWARTDAEHGVHQAPTRVALRGRTRLQRRLTAAEQGALNHMGVNCLRAFPGQGTLIWGARTLSQDSDWRYLHVRRLANHLTESISSETRWAAFERNDERLRATVRATVTSFLTSKWRTGALLGKTPEDSFHVICDDSNNPPETAQGSLSIHVGFAALRPAELISISIVIAHRPPAE